MYRVFSVFVAVALLTGVKCGESLSGYSGGSSGYSGYSGSLSSGSQSGFQPSVSLSSGSHGYSQGGLSAGLSAGSHGGYSQGGLSAGLSSGYSGLGSSGYSGLGSGLSLGGHGLSLGSGGYNLGSLGGHGLLGGFGGQGSQGLASFGGHGALASYGGQGSLAGYGGGLGLGSGFSQGSSGKFELNTDYSKGASIVSNHGGHDYSSGVSVVGAKTGGSGSHNGYAGRHTTIDLSGNAGNQHSGVYGGSFFAGKEHGHAGGNHDSYSSGVSSYDVGPGLGGYATEDTGKLAGYGTFEALDSGTGHNSGYPPLGQFH